MQDTTPRKYLVPQNLGWLDRLIRFMIGTAMLVAPVTYLLYLSPETPTWINDGAPMDWPYYSMLLSSYPLLTAMLGHDPVYALFGLKSCGTSPRNPCGTLPFEIASAAGNRPRPNDDVDHSLENSRQAQASRSR